MKKKILSLLLVAGLSVSLFAGGGSGAADADKATAEGGKEAAENLLPAVVKKGVGMLACQIVGSVVPVANNVLLSYKQHRLERNVLNSLRIIQSKKMNLKIE